MLEHVNFPAETLHDAYNVTKPGGWLFLDTPRRDALFYRISEWSYRLSGGANALFLESLYSPLPFRHKQIFTLRQLRQLAEKTGKPVTAIKKMTIWGNHSVTQFPDLYHAEVDGKNAYDLVNDHAWYETTYIPTVAKRGAAIIEARGLSSAASAANAAIAHMRSWALGTAEGDWTSMAFPSDGSYGVPEGLVYGFPVTVKNGQVEIVKGLEINAFSRAKMDATAKELDEERQAVKQLGLVK